MYNNSAFGPFYREKREKFVIHVFGRPRFSKTSSIQCNANDDTDIFIFIQTFRSQIRIFSSSRCHSMAIRCFLTKELEIKRKHMENRHEFPIVLDPFFFWLAFYFNFILFIYLCVCVCVECMCPQYQQFNRIFVK